MVGKTCEKKIGFEPRVKKEKELKRVELTMMYMNYHAIIM